MEIARPAPETLRGAWVAQAQLPPWTALGLLAATLG